METINLQVGPRETGERIDSYIARVCRLSRSVAQALLGEGNILVNGAPASKSYKLGEGDVLAVTIPPPTDSALLAQDIPLDIAYEDECLLVVNKPKGMVVHPAAGNPDGTLVNALLYHCKGSLSGIGGEIRPGIVHRIDKDTSGLLVVAKDDKTHAALSEQFSEHSITRVYHAVVHGRVKEEAGTIDAAIGRSKNDRKKMAVVTSGGREALTHYTTLATYDYFTYLSLQLETGRTHQIRVHMAYKGHPLAGDAVYGPKKREPGLYGQCLHAKVLGFTHPKTGERMQFDSVLPDYFTAFLHKLERTNHL